MRTLLRVLLGAACALLATHGLAAQCTPVHGSGCPGSLPPQCSGSASIGQAFKLACVNNGRADQQLLLVGGCSSGPIALTPPIACVPGPCILVVDLTAAVLLDTGFNTVLVQVPNNPILIGQTACFQCIDVLLVQACLTLAQAVQVTVAP